MTGKWTVEKSPLRYANPFLKAYVLLVSSLVVSFFSRMPVLILLTCLVSIIFAFSQIPPRLMWHGIRMYAVTLYPLFLLLFWLDIGNIVAATYPSFVFYLRFMNVIAAGNIFVLTSTPFDLIVASFRTRYFRNVGLSLMAAFTASLLFGRKVFDIVAFQRLRGIQFHLSPLRLKQNFLFLEALIVPITLQAIDFAENIAIALTSRGWGMSVRPTLPPYMKFSKTDVAILLVTNLLMILAIYL